MKVQAKHGKVTRNMHGENRNYRYVWDISTTHAHVSRQRKVGFHCRSVSFDLANLYYEYQNEVRSVHESK